MPGWQLERYFAARIRDHAALLNPAKPPEQLVQEARALRYPDHLQLAAGGEPLNYSHGAEAQQFLRDYFEKHPRAKLREAFARFERHLRKKARILPLDVRRPYFGRNYFSRYAGDPVTTRALIAKFFPQDSPDELAGQVVSRVGGRYLALFTHPEIWRTRQESLRFVEQYLQSHAGAHPFEVFQALEASSSWGYETLYRAMWLTKQDAAYIRRNGLVAPGLVTGDRPIARMYDPTDTLARNVFEDQNRQRVAANGTAIGDIYNSFTLYPDLGASIAYWHGPAQTAATTGKSVETLAQEAEAARRATGCALYIVEARVPRLNAPAATKRPGGSAYEWSTGEVTYAINDPEVERLVLFNVPGRLHPEGGGYIVSVRRYGERPAFFEMAERRNGDGHQAWQGPGPRVLVSPERMGRLADAVRSGETLATLEPTLAQRAQLERAATDVLRAILEGPGRRRQGLWRAVKARQEWLESQGYHSWGGDFNTRVFGGHAPQSGEVHDAELRALRYLAQHGLDGGLKRLARRAVSTPGGNPSPTPPADVPR